MTFNPSVTLNVAIGEPTMSEEQWQNTRAELQAQGLSIWDKIISAIRADMQEAGIDLETVSVEINDDTTEEPDRYITIAGIQSDQAETVRAIIGSYFTIVNPDFDPTDYDEEESEEPWHIDYDFLDNDETRQEND